MTRPRTIAFLGRSGSGKDTQAKFTVDKLDPVLVIHTGAIFREIMNQDTAMSKHTKKVMDEGGLIPHWFASFAWQKEMFEKLEENDNIIFPSSPRNMSEAKELDEVLEWINRDLSEAVLVDIPEEEATKRLLARGRFDDNTEDIKRRLEWFKTNVEPTADYYEEADRLHRVDGMGSVEEVAKRVKKALGL